MLLCWFLYSVLVAQTSPSLCNPMDCSLPGFPVHGILYTGVGSYFLLQGIFLSQGLNLSLLHCRWTLYHLSQQENQEYFFVRWWVLHTSRSIHSGIRFGCGSWLYHSKWVMLGNLNNLLNLSFFFGKLRVKNHLTELLWEWNKILKGWNCSKPSEYDCFVPYAHSHLSCRLYLQLAPTTLFWCLPPIFSS